MAGEAGVVTNAQRGPDACADLRELRAEIDIIDTALFDLFAERMRYIHRAATLKKGTGIPANVPERVREVVANARARATERGLDAALYGAFWEALVDAAIAQEERLLGCSADADRMNEV